MGHFFPPPPPQIVAANAAQPFAPSNLPPSLEVVPNPPFVNANKSPTAIWQNAAIGQPNPWVYAYEDIGSRQPYAQGMLPPSVEIVPNPPFINANKTPTAIFQGAFSRQSDAWPYVFLDNTASGQPYGPGSFFTPSGAVVVVTQTPYSRAWLGTVVQSWFGPDPPPTLPARFNPAVFAQRVDNPPFGFRWQPSYVPSPVVFIAGAAVAPQGTTPAVTTQNPYSGAWLPGVIQSWFGSDPLPTLPRNLNPFFTAVRVDNPPFGARYPVLPYPSDSIAVQRSPYFPQTTTVVVTAQTPYSNVWIATVLAAWVPADPPPTLPRNLNPSQLVVPNPPFPGVTQLPGILAGWQLAAPTPTIPARLSPGIPGQSVDNPPAFTRFQPPYPADSVPLQQQTYAIPQTTVVVTTQGPYNNTWLASVIQSWFGTDPLPTLPRNLNPSITAVPVNNPPFSHYGRASWVAEIAVLAWQPPDPLPTLSGKLNPTVLAVPVNNPPFGSRTELPGILAAWASWPPQPLPTPSASAPQVQPGPPPPPPPPGAFTVSGPDVSTYLQEFFYDVSYTDAAITKRTV